MIHVAKPARVPAILEDVGARKRRDLEQEFLSDRGAFESGERTFEFDREIYGALEVRRTLERAQHHKCCFCERKIESGDVEHFRPKAGFRQARHDRLERPGYYWLAYEWSNLYLACGKCNQRNKENLFPLCDSTMRVHSHERAGALVNEAPIFIDPGVDDPEEFIEFNENQPRPRNEDSRAHQTILALELGRSFLMGERLHRFNTLSALLEILELSRSGRGLGPEDPTIRAITSLVANSTRDEAEFTSMNRCCIRERFGANLRMPMTGEEVLAFVAGGELPTLHN